MSKRKNGEGSWGKKKVGNNIYVYFRDTNGNYTYGKTQKEVNEKRKKKEEQMFLLTNKTTFGEYIQEWLKNKYGTIEPTTYDCYETLISSQIINFKESNLANVQLRNLNSNIFQKHLNLLAKKYSRSTIEKIWAIIKQCVSAGEIKNELPMNTTALVKVPIESEVAVKKKDIPFLSLADMECMYNVLSLKYKNGAPKYNESAHALILMMYSGMRISEMTALKWKNVDLDKKVIYIKESSASKKIRDDSSDKKYQRYNKTTKTPGSIRAIPLPSRGMEMIEYFNSKNPNHTPNDFVCITKHKTQMERRNVNKTLKKMIRDSECSIRDFSAHTLRHTYGSTLLSQGVEIKTVSELLGHDDVSTTYNIYIGILEKDKRKDVQRVFDNLGE